MQLLISLTLLLTCSHIWLISEKNSALIWYFCIFSLVFFRILKEEDGIYKGLIGVREEDCFIKEGKGTK